MITANNLVKTFDKFTALNELCCNIEKGSIYGLVGSNGSGKSTFLRLVSGVYKPDGGEILVDGKRTFENNAIKNKIFFVADEPFFFSQYTVNGMAKFYKKMYSNFDMEYYKKLCDIFPIDPRKKISTFSKGMKRQAMFILALASRPEILLLDEAFDGVDPVIRELLKKILADNVCERQMTVIVASHNLRELEELCDHVGLLHKGGILFDKELDSLKLGIHKIQLAFEDVKDASIFDNIKTSKIEQKGRMFLLTVKGDIAEIEKYIESLKPIFYEALPLTLEEVFISEMEGVGYDFSKIIL